MENLIGPETQKSHVHQIQGKAGSLLLPTAASGEWTAVAC